MSVRSLLLALALLVAAVPPAACQVSDPARPTRSTEPSPESSPERMLERMSETEGVYRVGDPVEIQWQGGWYRGHVLEAEGGRYEVGYDGYSDTWDEWVGPERLRRVEVGPEPVQPEAAGPEGRADEGTRGVEAVPQAGVAGSSPPLGKYVCRQYTTTMGYLTLRPGGVYEVSGVTGRYRYDAATGEVEWEDGSYAEWDWRGSYEHVSRPAGDGRPDEDVIRLTSEADGLRITCYKMEGD